MKLSVSIIGGIIADELKKLDMFDHKTLKVDQQTKTVILETDDDSHGKNITIAKYFSIKSHNTLHIIFNSNELETIFILLVSQKIEEVIQKYSPETKLSLDSQPL